jgi:hypothetical protein
METLCAEYGWTMEYVEWAPLGRLLAVRTHLGVRHGKESGGPNYVVQAMIAARRRVQAEQEGKA